MHAVGACTGRPLRIPLGDTAMKTIPVCILTLLVMAACERRERAQAPGNAASNVRSAQPADSQASMSFLLRRFQARAGTPSTDLSGGATDLDGLARAFVNALEKRDTMAVERMIVTVPEFAHLYFPQSIFMRAPYELDPAVVWMQLDAATTTGMRRALARYGGTRLGYLGIECRPADIQGLARIHGCDVRRIDGRGEVIRERLFGPVLERGGRFKFLSLQNGL